MIESFVNIVNVFRLNKNELPHFKKECASMSDAELSKILNNPDKKLTGIDKVINEIKISLAVYELKRRGYRYNEMDDISDDKNIDDKNENR